MKILTYHVVAKKALAEAVTKMIKDDGGTHPIPTVSGGKLTATMKDGMISLTDENGGMAKVTIADVNSRTASSTSSTRCCCRSKPP